ncbi:Na+/H+ antiporter NhaA [Bacteroidota bacterium]
MITRLYRPFETFFRQEAAGGILLLITACIAMIWANSNISSSYFDLWNTGVTVGAGSFEISKPLLLWINDGLMAIFFFVVGLEIKREVLTGELSNPKKAALALSAAIGGMVVPAIVYTLFNAGLDTANGWGIPMATDIAFALGVLALLGSRAPLALKVFLTALAIADDLGAVLVIALFYTAELSVTSLLIGFAILAVLIAANRAGVTRTSVYVILGIALWIAFLKSGVHATIAGVLLALTIPARRQIDALDFKQRVGDMLSVLSSTPEKRQQAVHSIETACVEVESPLMRMEHAMHGWVAFMIMPVFALANAGVTLTTGLGTALGSPATIGIVLGLVVGKQFGVTTFAWLAVKLKLAELPEGISWSQIYGVSILTGIGFTMSLFVASLAFNASPEVLDNAKVGILMASLIAGIGGWIVLSRGAKNLMPTDRE